MRAWLSRIAAATCLGAAAYAQSPEEIFERKIRPLLAANCYACHAATKLGGLQLDSREAMLKGGKSGPALVPGDPDSSLLIRAVTHADPKMKMPLGSAKLKESEIADLTEWVKSGAPWPASAAPKSASSAQGFHITPEQRAFWSFQPVTRPAPPPVKDAAWTKGAIDRFLLAKLEEKGLKPTKAADKRALIRRATFDLIGLPPTPEQVEAFVADSSPDAFAKVVDRLLVSPHYGERWGRHWLDLARYADGERGGGGAGGRRGGGTDPYRNSYRYRDWVIQAFNQDMPYDLFVKAQIAADLLSSKPDPNLLPGLGLFGLGPWVSADDIVYPEARSAEREDRIDVLSKGFLGLTVACAKCHDHKYDPISQKDYYALAGVFASSGYWEYNFAPEDKVAAYKAEAKVVADKQTQIREYMEESAIDVAERMSGQIADYMMAARKFQNTSPKPDAAKLAAEANLHAESLQRWIKYLASPDKIQHPYLKGWFALMVAGGGTDEQARKEAQQFQKTALAIVAEKREINRQNNEIKANNKPGPNEEFVRLPGDLLRYEKFQFRQFLVTKVLETEKFYVWLDLIQSEQVTPDYPARDGIFEYSGATLESLFDAAQKSKLAAMRSEVEKLEAALPAAVPFAMGLADNPAPLNAKLNIRGNPHMLGDEVPRGFPAVLAKAERDPEPFHNGSGRLELAEAIAASPLTPRVIANRIWLHHFGRGIVATPSNFGMVGERPTHPELLDYLASRLIENKWSIKSLHREIMLSAAYQLSSEGIEKNLADDPDNRLFWRANLRRLDVEVIRDSMLFVAGALDERVGGPPEPLNGPDSKRRTVYGRISRQDPDKLLLLFDFPDPTVTGEMRVQTTVPLQSLFFMNSEFIWRQSELLSKRLAVETDETARIQRAYHALFGRSATGAEVKAGLDFVREAGQTGWQQYAQALLSAAEFSYVY